MATNFPTSLDSYTTKVDGAGNKIFAAHINDPQDAIEALEAKVGIDGSAVTTSLDYLIANKVVKNDQINTITANSASALLTLNQQGTGDAIYFEGGTKDFRIYKSGNNWILAHGVGGAFIQIHDNDNLTLNGATAFSVGFRVPGQSFISSRGGFKAFSAGDEIYLDVNSAPIVLGASSKTFTGESVVELAVNLKSRSTVFFQRGVTAGITASVTQTQGNGALTSEVNEVSTVTNPNDTVTLPSAAVGMMVTIINNGANTLQIFPASGDDLGAGVDIATTLAAGSNVVYIAYDATNWEAV